VALGAAINGVCLRRDFPANVPPVFDALVLLGCRIGPGRALTGTAERRVEAAARAFADGLASTVIVSGGRRWDGLAEAEVMAEALIARGVPHARVVLELLSLSTCENAHYSVEIARTLGAKRLGVVTCDWHMRRALAGFRAAGCEAQAMAARTPQAPIPERLVRAGRERLSFWVDRVATWGAFAP
jgi:uncharacterized SAM-binding protein YcdF (DUF218 family)